jgi:hypothetical protein
MGFGAQVSIISFFARHRGSMKGIAKRFPCLSFQFSRVHAKVGTRVRLKITAIDHDHGFKIGSVPDGSSSADKRDLIFTSEQECWQSVHCFLISLFRVVCIRHFRGNPR